MNERCADFELLRAFVEEGNQKALADVIRRHLDLVYATALRKAEDVGAAEEIAQNVFASLARKAWQFASDDSLPAWLYRTTLLEAKSWLRGELRRRRREQTAAELGTTMKTPDEQPALRALLPLLDEALLSLREKDRTALLLRYYESHSLRDVGAALGLGEDAARKRVAGALERLANFFQRRGFKTATVTATAAALQHTAASAPAATASIVVQATLQSAPPALAGLGLLLARLASLSKAQVTVWCVAVAAVPLAWQWNEAHAAEKQAASMQLRVDAAQSQQEQMSSELERLRAESGRLDAELTKAAEMQVRNAEAARKLEELKKRVRGLLTDPNYRWPDDLPYVRIPKSLVKDVKNELTFGSSGTIRDEALEILGITPEERIPTEEALGNYWNGVRSLMATHAYETNSPSQKVGRVAKTVIVPPLGQDLKTLANDTREQIIQRLGAEREKMLFGDWAQGAIQIFSPGNLWKISEEPQNFTVWIDPVAVGSNGPLYGAGWHRRSNGMSQEGEGSLSILPPAIATRFFIPWLRQFGVTNPMPVFVP